MQHVTIFKQVTLQLLQAGMVKRYVGILLNPPIQLCAMFPKLLPEKGTELLLDPGKGLIQSGRLQWKLVKAQVKSPKSVELHL